MQVTETRNEGLSREFAVTIQAQDIDARIDARLQELKSDIRLPGFRPGKVPMSLLRKRFARAVMGEVLEAAVSESTQQALDEQGLRPAMQPKIEVKEFDEGKDLEYTMAVELIPDFEPMDFSGLQLERLKGLVADKEIDEAVDRMAKDLRTTETVSSARKSKTGDVAVIDFKGMIDGEPFDGGAGEDFQLELGSSRFIAGFEEQLIGAKAGDHVTVGVKFPEDYPAGELAGRDATFEVDVKELREYVERPIDDEFAKSIGMETLDDLRKQVGGRLEQEYAQAARARLKRDLLDKLNDEHQFDVPKGMVDGEFDSIWAQFEKAKEAGQLDPEDTGRDEEELKDEYRTIAERRVRLGLLLSEVGRLNSIQVSQDELNRAMIQEAQRHPGQERQVYELYQNNQEAMDSLRAPVFEDKVVDFILEMANVEDKEVSVEDLMKAMEADNAPSGGEAGGTKKKTAKKGTGKKTTRKKAG